MIKVGLYIVIIPLVVWAIDSINLNAIFKKNRIIQARIIYCFIVFSLSYLVVQFMYDFCTAFK